MEPCLPPPSALNGIDLTKAKIGDVLNLAPFHAAMLVAEGWAEEAPDIPSQLLERSAKGGSPSENEE
jgi:hypothetical protein